jgi:hypothetical protein
MDRPAAATGGTSHPGGTSLRPRGIRGLRCQWHYSTPLRASSTPAGLLIRTPCEQCLQETEECGMLVAQPHTEKGLTRLCGTSEAIAKARDGHLGRALLYHTRPPVATRRASAFVPIRRTDLRWGEDPSGGRSQPECFQTSVPSDAAGKEHIEHGWQLARRLCCPANVLTFSPPTAGRSCHGA